MNQKNDLQQERELVISMTRSAERAALDAVNRRREYRGRCFKTFCEEQNVSHARILDALEDDADNYSLLRQFNDWQEKNHFSMEEFSNIFG